ncbi:tRNA threonylcarbamoyladenosine dehydratase [Leptotrichia sp. OH3620_COT-345]|uniref:tRNA threonylcarbamoyladenosine dehydratase n=1 Tax=Leptotrichia sp. OH3620_COT-345 TaxID=2491048 RepID=UPI000F64A8EA|nr:tRNA threonylcarbamoyladenosine dehydratase [Leptotrichia sp. OH3620_COT-345]RRD41107.1 tRNA threonylcarbamoyladenosine dehydratase [Leptotrichia sp. OH3620_COT-345]
MKQRFSRFSMLVGEEAIEKLNKSNVIVFGVGGVGSYTVESLVRSGIGNITMVDYDEISESNINRQLHALDSTVGMSKIEVMKKRILNINPDCNVTLKKEIVLKNVEIFFENNNQKYDFAVDAIDVIDSKINIIEYCYNNNINIISSMGFGNKMHPEMIEISTIENTISCPMARRIRSILKKKCIKNIPVVFSREEVLKPDKSETFAHEAPTKFKQNNGMPRKIIPGSNAFVPGTAGLIIASYVIRNLLEIK